MRCIGCGSTAVSERPERTAQGYRRFRCRACRKQFNEGSSGALNWAQFPSDVIALLVFWRLRYMLSLRDLSEDGDLSSSGAGNVHVPVRDPTSLLT